MAMRKPRRWRRETKRTGVSRRGFVNRWLAGDRLVAGLFCRGASSARRSASDRRRGTSERKAVPRFTVSVTSWLRLSDFETVTSVLTVGPGKI